MTGTKRSPGERPSVVADRIAALREAGGWRVVVPYYARDVLKRKTTQIDRHDLPPDGVGVYTYAEAVDLLRMFCGRWTEIGQYPAEEIEPHAAHADLRFTLRDIDPEIAKLPRMPPLARPAPPPAKRKAAPPDEDEADRWLRENGPQRHIDL